ncbi:hypothetical protein AKJ09_00760 [Labilithrix luteola]|uniref:Uncharacterized protein n=1 Tax=Labilithrix luteola TaxID=1391654 RepID=A0A0K1PL06_9BACT|nr:hypothetical protein [Labilithrix luteola]AKU94096.1 hypothetical protein AKJ09_00760 [Labilithrix luteola]
MSELRSDTQALLSRAREAGGIPVEDRSRLKTAIFAQVTAASVMTTASAAAATSTGEPPSSSRSASFWGRSVQVARCCRSNPGGRARRTLRRRRP